VDAWLDEERYVRLEQPVPAHREAKHRPAQEDRVLERRPFDVLDDIRQRARLQQFPSRLDESRMVFATAIPEVTSVSEGLTRRAGVDRGEVLWIRLFEDTQCIVLPELEWVVGLRLDVDADDVEASPVVAHRCATSAAEKVEKARPGHDDAPGR
jgi:hypothetical protein